MSPCFLEKANVPEYEYLRALVTSMLIDLRLEDPTRDIYSLLKENNDGHYHLIHLWTKQEKKSMNSHLFHSLHLSPDMILLED